MRTTRRCSRSRDEGAAAARRFSLAGTIDVRNGRSRRLDSSIVEAHQSDRLVPLDAIHLLGPHLVNDVMAAATVGAIAGAAPEAMASAVDAFQGLEHAMELVAEVGRRAVRQRLESRPTSSRRSVRSRASIGIWCRSWADGSRGGDLRLPRDPLKARAKAVVAIGEARPLLRDALGDVVPVEESRRLRCRDRPRATSWRNRRVWCCSRCRMRELRHVQRLRGEGAPLQRRGKAA